MAKMTWIVEQAFGNESRRFPTQQQAKDWIARQIKKGRGGFVLRQEEDELAWLDGN
jgi:hypothetical protein